MISLVRILLLVFLSTVSAPPAPLLNYTETDLCGGFSDVVFTAVNSFDPAANAGVDLYDIVFDFPTSGFILSLPSGWTSNPSAPGTSMEALSMFPGPPPTGTDIAPGQSLGGFEFLFETTLGDIPFTYSFTNPAQPGQPLILSGTSTPVSSTVPEPSNFVLIGTTVGALLWFKMTHRRRK